MLRLDYDIEYIKKIVQAENSKILDINSIGYGDASAEKELSEKNIVVCKLNKFISNTIPNYLRINGKIPGKEEKIKEDSLEFFIECRAKDDIRIHGIGKNTQFIYDLFQKLLNPASCNGPAPQLS